MYCKHCGEQIDDKAVVCPKCGVPVNDAFFEQGRQNGCPPQDMHAEKDAPSAGFAVLSFFFPLIGLILYLVWRDATPLKAKSCGKGALIGVIVGVALVVLYYVLIALLIARPYHYYHYDYNAFAISAIL